MNRHPRISAAVGALALAAAITIPESPASADSIRDDQWYLKSLKLSTAQRISKGSGVIVAVLDTGTSPHRDLQGNLLAGKSLITGTDADSHADQDGHGTSMGALIAAHGRGSSGMLGIAPSAKILPIKVSQNGKDFIAERVASGVRIAVQNKAKVINISASTDPAFALRDAISSAISSDVVVVAAAGSASNDGVIAIPAGFDGVLAVGSSGRNGKHDSESVEDPKVDLCAPGVDIRSAAPGDKYKIASGTSDSSAIVSGAVALVRSKFPQLSGKDVVNRLTATADDIGPPGRDDQCGFGELNIVKALTADVPSVDGNTTASPSATAPTAAPAPSVGPTVATPAGPSDKSHTTAIAGGIAGVLAVGALIGFLIFRRRRRA